MEDELRADYFGYRVTCSVCGRTKQPVGRSAPLGLCVCDQTCRGFHLEPLPSHLWPNESEADFGYKVPR
jgi:recombinational DNA repair protein (RecF pathway)